MNATTVPVPRSTFVTVLAWIFIVLSGFATLISLMQNAMLFFMFRDAGFGQAMDKLGHAPNVPAFFFYFARYFYLFFALFLVLSAATLASSIGLLLRRNWGRILFIGLMGIGIAWNLGGLALAAVMMTVVNGFPLPPGNCMGVALGGMVIAMMVVNVAIALAFSALFAWIIVRLRSPGIRREFVPAS